MFIHVAPYGKQSLENWCVKGSDHNARDHYAVAVRRNGVIIRHLPSLALKKFKIDIFVKQLQLELTRICTYQYTCYNTGNIVHFDNL